jgi:IPT/TIG domain
VRTRTACVATLFAFLSLGTQAQEASFQRLGERARFLGRGPGTEAPETFSNLERRPGSTYILRESNGRISCQEFRPDEGTFAQERSPAVDLHQINHLSGVPGQREKEPSARLRVILRATAQLENYPPAKAAFIRAADIWESMISENITIYVDVDFGPTRFGTPFPDRHILGSTQGVLYELPYTQVRNQLVSIFHSDSETLALPTSTLPTDLGGVSTMVVPDAVLRELDLRPRTASATDEASAIGFNSAFGFDFDPSDGLGPLETEFLDVAIHELGHVLGFTSGVGVTELHHLEQPALSALDIHRFRPGVLSFQSEARVLSSGGEQVYFTDGYEAPLSTGRPDGTGGDLHQPSHWKDDELLHTYVGIMDPTLRRGTHLPITGWDLVALNRMGYGISLPERQPWITSLSPNLVLPGSGATTLLISGEDFAQGAQVLWKGQARAATVLSESSISLFLSAAEVAAEGTFSVEVQNPGSIPSNAGFFEISRNCFRCPRVVRR